MAFERSETLASRTYLGLILSQFLAAFNDQAIHIVAIFYGTDMLVRFVETTNVDEKFIVSVVTACFISPFFLFSPLAGMLADKYSKQTTLIFWKLAEVAMMMLALVGFLLPHLAPLGVADLNTLCIWSSVLVILTVFLMGTHSAFFIPAKYGVMPEILHPTILSRGNGLLEGTSFVAQIIGTSVGGFLYGQTKTVRSPSGELLLGREWLIGLLLLGLAILGAAASFLIQRMPAANPELQLTWKLWRPLRTNVGILLRSRPLALAVLGIAFFTFMTLFLRQALIYEGEAEKELQAARRKLVQKERQAGIEAEAAPSGVVGLIAEPESETQRSEMKIALLIAMVGLGVGAGSALAGYLSGSKVELGLVPIGAVFLILFNAVLAFSLHRLWLLLPVLVLIGMAAGLYIVPLYTLLQHRAPKDSKGNLVATSNFVNVAGGLVAVVFFYVVTLLLENVLGLTLTERMVRSDPELLPKFIDELVLRSNLPSVLCLLAALMTVGMLVLLCRQLPDFLVRTVLWLRSQGRYHLTASGVVHLPTHGPAILATDCSRFDEAMHVVAATDRYIRFFLFETHSDDQAAEPRPMERYLARQTGLVTLGPGMMSPLDWDRALNQAASSLASGDLVALSVGGAAPASEPLRFYQELYERLPLPVLPVRCIVRDPEHSPDGRSRLRRATVVFGEAVPNPIPAEAVQAEIERLSDTTDARPSHG